MIISQIMGKNSIKIFSAVGIEYGNMDATRKIHSRDLVETFEKSK